jgi:hypothetical protein
MFSPEVGSQIVLRDYLGALEKVSGVVVRVAPLTITITRIGGRSEMSPGITVTYKGGDGWIEDYPPSLLEDEFARLGVFPTAGQWSRLTEMRPYESEAAIEFVTRCLAELV